MATDMKTEARAKAPVSDRVTTGMTMAEKIMARAAGKPRVEAGEYVDCKLDGIMAYQSFVDSYDSVVKAGLPEGMPKIWNPSKLFLMVEHHQPPSSLKAAERSVRLRELADRYRLPNFVDTTAGICHQIMVDKAYALPGQLVIGSDSHTIMYGALNCASTGIGETDIAYAATFGELWFKVPESIKVELVGTPPVWPAGKDVMLYLAGQYGADFAIYKSIEFSGPGAAALSMDNRFCMSDHGIEVAAKFTLFPFDDKTREFLAGKTEKSFRPVEADPDATYSKNYTVDLSTLAPQIAAPHSFDNVKPIAEMTGIRIDQACVGSCANGRFEDIEIVARIVKGRKVHKGVRLLVSPASWDEALKCMNAGLPQIIIEAGGQFLDPGCGVCGAQRAFMAPGEVCITATTRNHQGRMGSPQASIYLASPATVAWSAVVGTIADPREVLL
jgi:3-isopropylmalate/(R)-2-methylmalate dehydratase large subunit